MQQSDGKDQVIPKRVGRRQGQFRREREQHNRDQGEDELGVPWNMRGRFGLGLSQVPQGCYSQCHDLKATEMPFSHSPGSQKSEVSSNMTMPSPESLGRISYSLQASGGLKHSLACGHISLVSALVILDLPPPLI